MHNARKVCELAPLGPEPAKMLLSEKTLDAAEDDFRHAPTRENAAALLTVATRYCNDGMIGDATYADKVRLVRDWLLAGLDPVDSDPESPIAEVARRIASYADGCARINVYRAATSELKQYRGAAFGSLHADDMEERRP